MKQRGDLLLVRLQLIERRRQGGVFITGSLQLDNGQRQAVDKHDDIRPAIDAPRNNSKLVDDHPVVGIGIVKIKDTHLAGGEHAVLSEIFHIHAFHEEFMDAPVLLKQIGQFALCQRSDGIGSSLRRQSGIESAYGLFKPPSQNNRVVAFPFRAFPVRPDILFAFHRITKVCEV